MHACVVCVGMYLLSFCDSVPVWVLSCTCAGVPIAESKLAVHGSGPSGFTILQCLATMAWQDAYSLTLCLINVYWKESCERCTLPYFNDLYLFTGRF